MSSRSGRDSTCASKPWLLVRWSAVLQFNVVLEVLAADRGQRWWDLAGGEPADLGAFLRLANDGLAHLDLDAVFLAYLAPEHADVVHALRVRDTVWLAHFPERAPESPRAGERPVVIEEGMPQLVQDQAAQHVPRNLVAPPALAGHVAALDLDDLGRPVRHAGNARAE